MFIRKKILIVEGMDMDRHFLRHILTNAGYTTEAVGSRSAALDKLDNEDFDVFFVDIHMPELDGIKLIKTLREMEEYQSVPILAVTRANPETMRQKGEAIGITDWVRKPISPQYLLHMLKEMGLTNQHHVQSLV